METKLNNKQLIFKELFVGTLIYSVVLSFFNDYSNLVYAKSASTIFFAGIVLELLTYGVFFLKKQIITALKDKQGVWYKAWMFFCVWLVLFLSKFVFIAAIDFLFGDNLNVLGFFGILAVVISVTVVHKLADKVFIMLGGK